MENKRPPINLVKNVLIFPQVKCKIILNKRRMLVFVTKDFLGFSTFLYFCIYFIERIFTECSDVTATEMGRSSEPLCKLNFVHQTEEVSWGEPLM